MRWQEWYTVYTERGAVDVAYRHADCDQCRSLTDAALEQPGEPARRALGNLLHESFCPEL